MFFIDNNKATKMLPQKFSLLGFQERKHLQETGYTSALTYGFESDLWTVGRLHSASNALIPSNRLTNVATFISLVHAISNRNLKITAMFSEFQISIFARKCSTRHVRKRQVFR